MTLTPDEAARLKQLEAEASEREEAQGKAESARIDEIAEALRDGGFPDHAKTVVVMTTLDELFAAYRGPLRRDLYVADPDLAEALDEARDDRLASHEAEEEEARRVEQEAQQKAQDELEATMTPEQLEAQAAADAADLTAQVLEDSLQQLVGQTTEALEAEDDYSHPGVMRFPGDAQLRPMPVERDSDGKVILDKTGHAIPRPFKPGYRGALEAGAGMFGIKHLADELIELPRSLQAEWWGQRSEAEKHALERGFGVRPPVTRREVGLE